MVERWATRAGCDLDAVETLASRDIDGFFPGREAEVRRYLRGCRDGVEVQLWRIPGGGHSPTLADDFATQVLDWLLRQR